MKIRLKYLFLVALVVIFAIIIGFVIYNFYFKSTEELYTYEFEENFELDTLFLKVAISEGGIAINNIKIKNIDREAGHFSVKVSGIENLVILEASEFDLASGQERNIKLTFNAENVESGVYLGKLEVSSVGEKVIPIILEIQSEEALFDSNINLFPTGQDIIPGQKISTEIKVFDLANIGTSNVELSYLIKDFSGRTIISETENLIVDKKLTFTKSINLPEDINLGDYVLINIVKYYDSVGTSFVLFKITQEEAEGELYERTMSSVFYLIILFGFFFLIFLGLFIYSVFYRDKLLRELQSQYKQELKRQKGVIVDKEKETYVKLKTPEEKKEYRREVEKVKAQRLGVLEAMQKKRVKEYKKIKKKATKKELERQLKRWKSQGYDTGILEKKYRLPSIADLRRKMQKWEAQGYDTSVLEK